MRDNAFYKKLRTEAQRQGIDLAAVKRLSPESVRSLAGANSGLSGTFLRNMKRSLTVELQQKEDDLLVSNIAGSIRDRYPQAEGMIRNRVVTIWLDGKPEEDDDGGL
jgi:hypothetical protein